MSIILIEKVREVIELQPKFGKETTAPISISVDWGDPLSDEKVPSEKLAKESIDLAQKAIAGIVDFDLTAEAGTTHTITILPEHSGKTLDIRANLDDVVTIIVGNDIVIEQPITIRKTGVFSLELRAANTDIVIEANDVEDDGGVDYVDITGEMINTVQIMRKSNNLIWVI